MPIFFKVSGWLFRIALPFLKFGSALVVFAMFFVFLKDIFNFLLNATDTLKNISASFNSSIPQVMQLYSFLGIHKFILMIIAAHMLSVSITITLVAIKAYGRKLPNIGFKK
jgi:hypothetical protein